MSTTATDSYTNPSAEDWWCGTCKDEPDSKSCEPKDLKDLRKPCLYCSESGGTRACHRGANWGVHYKAVRADREAQEATGKSHTAAGSGTNSLAQQQGQRVGYPSAGSSSMALPPARRPAIANPAPSTQATFSHGLTGEELNHVLRYTGLPQTVHDYPLLTADGQVLVFPSTGSTSSAATLAAPTWGNPRPNTGTSVASSRSKGGKRLTNFSTNGSQ